MESYAFHISKNHGFVDGNKRAGLASAITFLKINGIPVDISQRKIFKATWELTTSKIDKFQFAEILRDASPLEFSFMANLYNEKRNRVIIPTILRKK